jgi:hypothetical protein
MTTITIDRKFLEEVVELFDSAITARHPHEILRDIRAALAAPATAPEFPADWAQMIHYPECWDTAAYPELRDAIHEALAWSGCSVCKPATAPERKPMHEGEIQAAWLGQDLDEPIPYSFVLGIRSAERFNGIKETP